MNAVFAVAHWLIGTRRYASCIVDGAGHRALKTPESRRTRRFVYTSVAARLSIIPVAFFRTKAGIEQHLRESGVDFTILRASPFMEWHIHRLLGEGIIDGAKATIFGNGNAFTHFIAAADVAHYAFAA